MRSMTARELKHKLDGGGTVTILDVRRPDELELARLEGTLDIPMDEIPGRLEELPREGLLVCMCHHGIRSAHVLNYLEQQGFDNGVNLSGGIDAWSVQVDPTVMRY